MTTVKVGKHEKKEVTELNNEIYLVAKEMLSEIHHHQHMGWSGVGAFIDWLEENYSIKLKKEIIDDVAVNSEKTLNKL